ncbi:MAG: C39 family peptidase [bacterium]|nr:C39 family peptidase [bacterium]
MSKRKKILLALLIVFIITVIFYFTPLLRARAGFKVIGDAIDSWSFKLARVEKQIMYSAQTFSPARRVFDVSLKVPFHKQEHSLSCEVATLKMALSFYNVAVTESELIRDLKFETTESRNEFNIWADPDKGFVGNIDGKIPNGGYGVYEQPIIDLALQYRDAKKMENAQLVDVLKEVESGHPVIVWGSIGTGKDISWLTPEGKYIKAVHGEHTRVVIGFSGTPENPKYILLMDPIYGKVTMSKDRFLSNWGLLDNKAIVIY